MKARIDFITDARDTRPALNITYREWSSPIKSNVRVQADSEADAIDALTDHVGNKYYSIISIHELPKI